MRCFALYISSGLTASLALSNLLKGGNSKNGDLILCQNCFGFNDSVNIEFDLQDVDGKQIPQKTITLYNVNRYWYSQLGNSKLKGKKIVLFGGTKITPTLTRQNAYNSSYQSCYIINDFQMIKEPIFDGYISNSYTTVENGTTSLVLTVINTPEKELEIAIEDFTSNTLTIKSGMVWFPMVRAFILKYYLKKLSIPPIVKKGNITKTTSSAEVKVDNIRSLLSTTDKLSLQSILRTNFNCEIHITNTGTIIIKDIEAKDPEDKTALIKKALGNNIISDSELLTQPTMVDINQDQRIMITLPLTNRFNFTNNKYFTLITKSATLFNQNITGVGDTVIRYSKDGLVDSLGKYLFGTYRITQIWHTGISRSSDINAWTTKLEAMPTDNLLDDIKEIIRKLFKKNYLD